MAMPKIPKPQAGGSDMSGKPGGRPSMRPAQRAAGATRKAIGKIPVVGRPLSGLLGAARGGARAAGSAASAAQDPEQAGQQAVSGLTGAGKRAGKFAGRTAKRAVKSSARLARKAASRGLKMLMSNPMVGVPVLVVLLIVLLILGLGLFISGQTFVSSFGEQQADVGDVDTPAGAGGQPGNASVFAATQVEHDDTTETMEESARATDGGSANRARVASEIHSQRASIAWNYPAGEVEVIVAGEPPIEGDGRDVMIDVIPLGQRGLADLVEWMLPQWVAPYPVMIAEADGISRADEEWPRGSGETQQVLSCTWPDHEWAGAPPYTNSAGQPIAADTVTIKGPWAQEGQHVCHLIAAADTIWKAWGDVFGEHGFDGLTEGGQGQVPRLDLAAIRRIWVTDPPAADDHNSYAATIGPLVGNVDNDRDRLWAWLTFAALLDADAVPVSGQYDCGIIYADIDYIWDHMGEYAEKGGKMPAVAGLPLPESFYAGFEQGDLLVPWPCPRPVRAVAEAALRGLWAPVVWSQELGDFGPEGHQMVNGLPVSSAALGTMSSEGMDTALAVEHGGLPRDAYHAFQNQVAALPQPFDPDWLLPDGIWDLHSHVPSEIYEAWCPPDTRWISETAEGHEAETEPEAQPKGGLIKTFDGDQKRIAERYDEARALMAAAQGIRSKIANELATVRYRLLAAALAAAGVDWSDGAAVAIIGAQIAPQIAAETARLRIRLGHANEMVSAMADVLDYWEHATEQGELRPESLPGPTWQFECKHKSYDEALTGLDDWRGDELPDAASPLRTLYTVGGRGRSLSQYGDHVNGANSPFENLLRVAYHAELLPDLVPRIDPEDDTLKPMVSPTCSAERWLYKSCLMSRSLRQGSEFVVLPREWVDPRLPVKCPPIYADSADLRESRLGHFAREWDDAQAASMVTHDPFTSFHPCLMPDMEAAAWLADEVGLPIRGHGFRSWEDSDAWSAHPLVAAGGASRHNYGLALDFEWQPPKCWPPPHHTDRCPPDSQGSSTTWELCGMESRNGANGTYVDFTTPANVGDIKHAATVDPIMLTHWCWRFLDWASYKMSGMPGRIKTGTGAGPDMQWRYPIVGLLPLSIELWHWSYDGR